MMRARFWAWVCFFARLAAAGLPYLSELPDHRDSLPDFGKFPIAEVVRVVDGDTVILRFGNKETERGHKSRRSKQWHKTRCITEIISIYSESI